MGTKVSAARDAGFFRHRALILVAAGGAAAEGGLVALVAPGARPVAPQLTSLPSVAAYHDLRWLFTDGQSWRAFAAVVMAVLLARAALDATLLRLAWPLVPDADSREAGTQPRLEPPQWRRAFWSCLAVTALCWVLLSPAATLAFGVAVLPFSWPMLGALPIMLGVILALSHGGTVEAWWRRLPSPRAVGWLLASFGALSAAAAVIAHTGTAGALATVAVTGLFNARAWYGMAALAARTRARPVGWEAGTQTLQPRPVSWLPARTALAIPVAPVAGLLVLALVVGGARLLFTGAIVLPDRPHTTISLSPASAQSGGGAATGGASVASAGGGQRPAGGVLVVEGWGSWCCDAANNLRALEPGMLVRQFSYLGLDAGGNPLRSGPADDDLALPELGDKIAAQVQYLHRVTHGPVSIIAESEGTLGVYAMLDRHPGLPIGSVVLLSPIVAPGQLSFPGDGQGVGAVPPAALDELNHLVGTMSPYGSNGAAQLLASASQFGARFFSGAQRLFDAAAKQVRWLAVIPLADALTLPACAPPPGVLVVPAFHGGLLGNPAVLSMVARFIDGNAPSVAGTDQARLRAAAEVITAAAAAWRMPDISATCP